MDPVPRPGGWPAIGLPVPTGTEAAAFDARARAEGGIPGRVLMESAGRAAADVVEHLLVASDGNAPRRGPVVVLAGAGGNGGDGVVVARTLAARGRSVRLFVDPRRPQPDPLLHGHHLAAEPLPTEWRETGDAPLGSHPTGSPSTEPLRSALAEASLLVDALLGTGLSRAPDGPVAGWIRLAAAAAEGRGERLPVAALDIPSGVLADSGAVPGPVLPASVTIAFGAPKVGSLFHPGRARGGRLVVVEIGFPPWKPADARATLITGAFAAGLLPRRPLSTHKNAVGRLLLVAGGEAMGGAALLAVRAALRSGVGMLRVLCHPSHRRQILDEAPEVMVIDPADPSAVAEAVEASDAVAMGPGMGLDLDQFPARALAALFEARPRALLLDADALTLLGRGDLSLAGGPVLLTPHPGELARLLPVAPSEGPAREGPAASAAPTVHPSHRPSDPLAAAQAAADRWQSACLLKGAPSVVAVPSAGGAPPPPIRISASGGSAFARGGMGDVLTGVAGALLARGCAPEDAATLALHLTGRAADLAALPPDALLPSDLLAHLPGALAELREGGPTAASFALAGLPSVLLGLDAPR